MKVIVEMSQDWGENRNNSGVVMLKKSGINSFLNSNYKNMGTAFNITHVIILKYT
ncbi:MAG: hypothetical protein ACJA2S_004110 [Cyclobacteriaceae bacterium]|jgi:hypothetical protein